MANRLITILFRPSLARTIFRRNMSFLATSFLLVSSQIKAPGSATCFNENACQNTAPRCSRSPPHCTALIPLYSMSAVREECDTPFTMSANVETEMWRQTWYIHSDSFRHADATFVTFSWLSWQYLASNFKIVLVGIRGRRATKVLQQTNRGILLRRGGKAIGSMRVAPNRKGMLCDLGITND